MKHQLQLLRDGPDYYHYYYCGVMLLVGHSSECGCFWVPCLLCLSRLLFHFTVFPFPSVYVTSTNPDHGATQSSCSAGTLALGRYQQGPHNMPAKTTKAHTPGAQEHEVPAAAPRYLDLQSTETAATNLPMTMYTWNPPETPVRRQT